MSSTPTPYTRQFDFEDFSASNPNSQQPGVHLDAEFDAVRVAVTETQGRLAEIQRDDGRLRNQSVHKDALDATVRAMVAAGGNPRGNWAAATAYRPGDLVEHTGATYIAVAAHTSAEEFATDLGEDRWLLFASPNNLAPVFAQAFDGDGISTQFALDQPFGSIDDLLVFVDGRLARGFGVAPEVSLAGNDHLTFSTAPAAGVRNIVAISRNPDVSASAGAAEQAATDAKAAKVAAQAARDAAQAAAAAADASADEAAQIVADSAIPDLQASINATSAALAAHKQAGGSEHPVATTATAGFMSAADKQALDDLASTPAASFPAGTRMLFQQSAAPTGWTKVTTHNDKALRVVSGTAGSGGASGFSAIFGAGKSTGSHTLTVAQLAAHSHTVVVGSTGEGSSIARGAGSDTQTTSSQGSNQAHSHTLDLDLAYLDVIVAQKD